MNKTQLNFMLANKTIGVQQKVRSVLRKFPCNSTLRNRSSWLLLLLAWAVVGDRLVQADSLDQVNLAQVLPAATHLVVAAPTVSTTYKSIETSDFGIGFTSKLWNDVAAKQAALGVGSLLNPTPWLGINWSDLVSLETPGAVAVFSRNEVELAVAFLAKLGPDAQKHPFIQKILQVHGGRQKFTVSKIGKSTTLLVMNSSVKDKPSVCVAIGAQWCCVSSSTSAIQEWLSTGGMSSIKNRGKLAVDSLLKNAVPGELQFWLSPWELMKAYATKGNAKLLRSADMFGMPGLNDVQGVLSRTDASASQWSLRYSTSIVQPPANGLALLSYKTGPMPSLPNLSIDSMDFVSTSYIDMKPWFQGVNYTVDKMIDEDTPGNFGDLLDSILTDPDGPKIDVRKELIYKSGPLMMQFAATRQDDTQPGKLIREKVIACSLQDPVGAAKAVKAIFKDDEEVRFEQIGSYQCWTAENDESLFVSLTKGEHQVLCCAAVDDKYLYLATNSSWFKELISSTKAKNSNGSTLWSDAMSRSKGGSEAFSTRQAAFLGSWLERSWTRIPEQENREYRLVDWPSMLLTKVVVCGLAAKDIPQWNQVRSQFGVLVHESVQKGGNIEGSMVLTSPSTPVKP